MALLFKWASSLNSDFLLLPTGEHLFTCQNVRWGGKRYFSFSGWSQALRCEEFVPSLWPPLLPPHQEEGAPESTDGEPVTLREAGSSGLCAWPRAPAQHWWACLCLNVPRWVAGCRKCVETTKKWGAPSRVAPPQAHSLFF